MPEICVTGTGRVKKKPDFAVISLTVRTREKSKEVCKEKAFTQFNTFRAFLRDNYRINLTMNRAETKSIYEQYDHQNPTKVLDLIGYTTAIDAQMEIRATNSTLSAVIRELDKTGFSYSCIFTMQDMQAAKTEAIVEALMRAREIADTIAQSNDQIVQYAKSVAYGMTNNREFSRYKIGNADFMLAEERFDDKSEITVDSIAEIEVTEEVKIVYETKTR